MRLLSAGPALTQPSMQRAAKHLSGSRAACGGEEDAGISFVDRSARADTEQVYSTGCSLTGVFTDGLGCSRLILTEALCL